MCSKLLVIGISGVTCGGKTTLAQHLKDLLPNCHLISQDDYFLDVDDPRHVWIPELEHINFDILTSLDMERMNEDISAFMKNKHLIQNQISTRLPSIDTLEELKEKVKKLDVQILIVEGFSIFNYKPFRNLFHLKYYFTLSKEECFKRRQNRVYEPPDCPGYFEQCAWPEYEKQLQEVKEVMQDVRYFNGELNNSVIDVLMDILKSLN